MSRRYPATLHSRHAGRAGSPLLVLIASVSLALSLIGASLSLAGPIGAWASDSGPPARLVQAGAIPVLAPGQAPVGPGPAHPLTQPAENPRPSPEATGAMRRDPPH